MRKRAFARPSVAACTVAAAIAGGPLAITAGLTLAAPAPSFAATLPAGTDATVAKEYLVTDNYPDLNGWLQNLGDATVVKVTASTVGTGATVLPKQVSVLTGWDKSFFEDKEDARQLGYGDEGDSFTFETGSTAEVRSIEFELADDKLVVPAGTNVTFKNVTFSNRIVIEKGAKATFSDCTFTSGTIENEGQASYSGSTKEPKNEATPETQFQSLGIEIPDDAFDDTTTSIVWAVNGEVLDKAIDLDVTGTNASKATFEAKVSGVEGVSARVDKNGTLQLSGTPKATGTATVTVSATAPGDQGQAAETKTVTLNVEVNAKLSLTLTGKLDAVRTGQGDYQDSQYHEVTMRVAEDGGTPSDFATWQETHDGAEVAHSIDPTGSGLRTAFINAGGNSAISVSGTADEPGTYHVTASLTYKGQTVTAQSSNLRIYEGTETLKGQLAGISGTPDTWQMEPYEIWRSNGAVVPTWLHRITGSDQSGLYGQIGNNGTDNGKDAFASDTLTIPAGADLTLENIKVNSSVKIVVEHGAKLTLLDSVAFGPIEVNGGTLCIQRDEARKSGTTSTITLNDGSVLENSQVISDAQYLTDGRAPKPEVPEAPVIVNGTVTFKGENAIQGDEGQDALHVSGTATIPDGSSLTVTGGSTGVASTTAGAGAVLDDGTVTGEGSFTAIGGSNDESIVFGGMPAKAVTGTGSISTGTFTAQGGNGGGYSSENINGADAGEKGVWVSVPDGSCTITGGTSINGTPGVGKESFSWGQQPGHDGNDAENGENGNGQSDTGRQTTDAKADKGSAHGALPQTGDGNVVLTAAVLAAGAVISAVGGTLLRRERR